jgi:hypothetical protein
MMQIPVLVEQIAGDGYRARGSDPFALTAKGRTREEALAKLREKVEARVQAGTIVALDITTAQNPLARFAGMFKDDPWLDDWKKSMADYRRKINNDPDAR